ncbi:MAG: M56 family metallopeptidase [Cyanobacteria bacterium J06598_1]
MIGGAVAIAAVTRLLSVSSKYNSSIPLLSWQRRWAKSLVSFAMPPLFLLMTAVAVLVMGPSSCHEWEGQLSYRIAQGFVLMAGLVWLQLSWTAFSAQRAARQHPQTTIQTGFGSVVSHVMDSSVPFSAQVGCWSPVLVISKGLANRLDSEHLDAVLAHEKGHDYYRDTFWFFWLGGLRRLTFWLPASEYLWQELLLLREIRADEWATQRVDSLVLAESLVSVVSTPLKFSDAVAAGFSCPTAPSRLAQRIDALLAEKAADEVTHHSFGEGLHWLSLALTLTPLLTIPFHH